MASRSAAKQAARERRLEEERAASARARRTRRARLLGAAVVVVVAVTVAVVLVTGGGGGGTAPSPRSRAARSITGRVDRLLAGIPEHGATLGNPRAPVTLTEFGDLECPYCAEFATGAQAELIARDVRAGRVKLVYDSFETATGGGPDAALWPAQQAAAYAAGRQDRAWYDIELFYREQGAEDSGYATTRFIEGIAHQIPGLSYARWNAERFSPALAQQVIDGEDAGRRLGVTGTPTVVASGPRERTRPFSASEIGYGELAAMIRSVA